MDFSIFKGGLFISAFFWQNKDVLGLIRKDIICSVEKKHPTLNSILLFQAPKKTHMKILLSMIRAPRLLTGIFYHMDHIYLIVPQWAYKVVSNEVTVEKYFMSLINRHPVHRNGM